MTNQTRDVLVIGGGSIGERHLRCFLHTGRARVSLCEIDAGLRDRLAARYPLSRVHSTLAEALQHCDGNPAEPTSSGFDAAVICTPAHLHLEQGRELARRRVGLLIEKPLSASLAGVDEFVTMVLSHNVHASVAYVYRAHPALEAMKAALESDRWGRPVQVVAVAGQHFPFYRPAYRDIYYTNRATGGGAIQDALTHLINAAEWLVGPVTRLVADAEHCVLAGVEVEDTAHLLTRHEQVLGCFSLNQHQPPNECSLTVVCERGAVRFELHRHRWLSCAEPGRDWEVEGAQMLERDELFVRQAQHFLDELDGRAVPRCSLADAVQTLRVNQAALLSLSLRHWVDPANLD